MKDLLKNAVIAILSFEARMLIMRHKPRVVAITGSLGKTGTKDAIATVLASTFSVRRSPKSFNSEFGVPLTILDLPNAWNNPLLWLRNIAVGLYRALTLRTYPEVLVLEVGADKPGDIAKVASWLPIEVAVITAVPEVPVHVVYYSTAAAVLKEKASLMLGLQQGGTLVTGDDARVAQLTNTKGKTIRIMKPKGEVLYENGNPTGMRFFSKEGPFELRGILGEHQGYAPLFAFAVGELFGITRASAITALAAREYTPGRMRLIEGVNGSTIIDDSYNSSPAALTSALETLKSLKVTGRKIAIIGDMRELGSFTEREHIKAGELVASIVDELYTVGEYTPLLAQSAREHGLIKIHSFGVLEAEQAGEACKRTLAPHDVVLIKSSQGRLRLEKAVKILMQHQGDAQALLVRQDEAWLKR